MKNDQLTFEHLINDLKCILNSSEDRENKVFEFQKKIADNINEMFVPAYVKQFLIELSEDTDYYEPDPHERAKVKSFFGDDKLETILQKGIDFLETEKLHIK